MKLLLFDIDGTILKFKETLSKKVFSELILKVFGQAVPEHLLPSFAGMTDLKIIVDTAEVIGLSKKQIDSLLPKFWAEMQISFEPLYNSQNIELMPGIKELIEFYNANSNYQLGLLTGNHKECAYMKLRPHFLDSYFPFGAFGDEHYDRNKLPEIALKRANIHTNKETFNCTNTLIIGDSPMDIKCANTNNIKSLTVATGNYSKEYLNNLGTNYCFSNFEETKLVIKKIEELLT